MTTLEMALLGSFQASLDGQPITGFESDKVRALLAYLAVEADRPHRREALAALLWPKMPESTARSNLRHALANLRRAIHDDDARPPFLHITRQTIQFNQASQFDLDARPFLRAAPAPPTMQQYEEMASCYRGEFLAGFSVADSMAFEEWTAVRREQCHRQMLTALHELAHAYARRGQYEQALPHAQRLLVLEPWDEAAHRQLMRLLALAGQRSAALAQYERCRQTLKAELGVEPTAVTTTLYERIRDETWPDAAARRPLPGFVVAETTISPPPRFVSRERQLQQLRRFLAEARTGHSRIAFVTGEAGSGKTALLHAFARRAMAADPDLLLASGKCSAYTGSGDPYLPFREIIATLTADVEAAWEAGDVSTGHARRLWDALPQVAEALVQNGRSLLDRFVAAAPLLARAQVRVRSRSPEEAPWLAQMAQSVQAGETAAPLSQMDLFVQYTALLTALARQRPLLLLVDDLQWIDSGSLNLLFHLGQQLHAPRILILGAYRPGDVAQPRDGKPHPLVGVVNELQRIFGPNQVDLSRAAGRSFIDALLDSEPNRLDEQFRRELLRQTGGHALFTTELLRGLQERGDLIRDEDGRWTVSPQLDWDILPARVEAVIAARVARLPARCRTALTIASVEGETFTAEVVAHVQGGDVQDTVRCLSGDLSRQHRLVTAQSRQQIGSQPVSRYRFHHFLIQKYLYGELDAVMRADMHEAVGRTLETLLDVREASLAGLFGQLAWHYQKAGALEKAIEYYQKAGQRAWFQLSAADEAIAHFRQGLALLAELPSTDARKQQEMGLQMDLAMPLLATQGFASPAVKQTYDRIYLLSQQIHEFDQLPLVLGFLGSYYISSAQYHKGLDVGQQLHELGRRRQDQLQIILSHLYLGANTLQLGAFVQCRRQIETLIGAYDFHQHHKDVIHYGVDPGVNGLVWAAFVTWVLGFPQQAEQYCREAIELAQVCDHALSLTLALELGGGIVRILARDYAAAREDLDASLALAVEQNFGSFEVESRFYLGFLQVMAGDVDDGLGQMQQALAGWRATGMCIMTSVFLSLLAQAQMEAGQLDAAQRTLDEAFAWVAERDERFCEAELHRIQGDLWGMAGRETAVAESAYQQAIAVAREQKARSWELRAALHLARLWRTESKTAQARSLLSGIFDWFTEGVDTPDLQMAAALLNELADEQG